ncbi:hypothetical protein U1Q18_015367 [Sarracenia purpurea var. burkii]
MIYLLSHNISRRIRQYLILLCEAHFALKYILQLNLISKALEQSGSLALEILSQLGLLDQASSGDFVKIAGLAFFCAVYNHGSEMLFSFSTIMQRTPFSPIGWRILKAGLNKSVLLSVHSSTSKESKSSISSEGITYPTMIFAFQINFSEISMIWNGLSCDLEEENKLIL